MSSLHHNITGDNYTSRLYNTFDHINAFPQRYYKSPITMYQAPKTQLPFYKKNKISDSQIKSKYLDFSSSVTDLNIQKKLTQENKFINTKNENFESKAIGTLLSTQTKNSLIISNSPIQNLPARRNSQLNSHSMNKSFVPPKQLNTIKDREGDFKTIRNRRLSIQQEINLPNIKTYRVNNNLKAPILWEKENKLKLQIHTNCMKTLLMQSSKKNSFDVSQDSSHSSDYHDDETENNSDDSEIIFLSDPHRKMNNAREVLRKRSSTLLQQEKEKEDLLFMKNSKKQIIRLKKEIGPIKMNNFENKYEFLNALHKDFRNKLKYKYKDKNSAFNLYKPTRNRNNLKNYLATDLYVKNKIPLMQINDNITFPHIINDSNVLANIYNVNIHKLDTHAKKYKQKKNLNS